MAYKRSVVTGAVVLLAALIAAGAAWACTSAANISIGPISGPSGAAVTITGRTFSEGPVEIRLDDKDGELLGTAQGPDFSVQVTIPAGTKADVYYLLAVQNVGGTSFKATETFEITGGRPGASATSAASDLWSGLSGEPAVAAEAPVSASSGPGLPFGAAMTAFGIAGLGAVTAVAMLRRSRVRTPAQRG